jgi:hypothetical protein
VLLPIHPYSRRASDPRRHDTNDVCVTVSREAASEYVTFHGLRNWGKTMTGNYLSHQIYVHSKVRHDTHTHTRHETRHTHTTHALTVSWMYAHVS